VLSAGLLGLLAGAVIVPQWAQAVTVSFTSAQNPDLCAYGTCEYDVKETASINYAQLLSTYPPSYAGYNYNFRNTLTALHFVNAYQAVYPVASHPANNGALGFGEIPANPGLAGGPLFFTSLNVDQFLPGTTLTSATGQYYTTTSTNFSSSQGGTGLLVNEPVQNQIWAVFRCTSGVCLPAPSPLPILGIGAAFGYSRRLRQRIQHSKV
jgi:hypothetical protein